MERRVRRCKDKIEEHAVPRVGVGVRAGCDEEVSIHNAPLVKSALDAAGYLNSLRLGSYTGCVDRRIRRLAHNLELRLRDLGDELAKEEVKGVTDTVVLVLVRSGFA